MPTKAKGKKKKTASKDKKDAKPKRPTRCGDNFKWEQRPKLVEAASLNNVVRVEKLITRGEDVNEALHFAIGRGKLEVVNKLIENGADLHAEIKPGDYWVPPPPAPKTEKKAKKSGKGKKKGKKKKK